MSVRGDLLDSVHTALLDSTSAERNVYESRTDALGRGTQRSILVRLAGAEEFDERSTEETDARRLPVQLVAFARKPEALVTLAEEIDDVLAMLMRDGVMRELPLPSFGDSQGEEPRPEQPVWFAVWELRLPYRVSIDDPSQEA